MKIIPFVALVSLTAPAFAQGIPQFDVDAHCKKVAGFSGTYSATIDKSCFDIWSKAPTTS